MTKHIFVTGGVVSSLGKGLTSASIGLLLERRGCTVRLQKLDPYLNVDPGTMSPYQHGEVYVLDDGTETDLDLGHYERFTHAVLNKDCNYTTGKIYLSVMEKERHGDSRGKTVQVIPHVTDEIKSCIRKVVAPGVDVVITESGGTVGAIEGMPYYEAIRQYALDVGKNNCQFVHHTLVPYLKAAGELKTKPTQRSVRDLREIGIQPDVLICRTEREIPKDECEKIALFCNVERNAVIEEKDKEFSIYEVPLSLAENKLDELIVAKLGLTQAKPLDMADWRKMLEDMRAPAHEVTIGFVGKYVKHRDAYKSVYESLDHAGISHRTKVKVVRIESDKILDEGAPQALANVDGLLIPGGFDKRGIEGKIEAIKFARETGLPFFGICLGLQCATIEFARHIGLENANSTEFDKESPHPVVCLLEEQEGVTDLGGTQRLGAYPCHLKISTKARAAFGVDVVSERHRHRYEVNNKYRERLEARGMVFSGTSPDGGLVEAIELKDHPWFVGVQSHPEFQSKPTKPHPLFRDFIGASLERRLRKTVVMG